MDERQVVTGCLRHRGPDGDRLLLVRRGAQVSTDSGRWAALRGTVETTPDEQALTELQEETGLDPEQLRPLARGEPLVVEDGELNGRWVVHPYLFAIGDPAAVRLDGEQSAGRRSRSEDERCARRQHDAGGCDVAQRQA